MGDGHATCKDANVSINEVPVPVPPASFTSLFRSWFSRAPLTELRKKEMENYSRSLKNTPEENAAEIARAKSACLPAMQAFYDCQQTFRVRTTMCTAESDNYFKCFRKERGFIRARVLGIDFDLGTMLEPETTKDDNSPPCD